MPRNKVINPLIFSVFLVFFTAISSHAADATFSWTANAEPVSGYKIHYGTSSRNYTFVVDVGLPEPVNGSIVATVTGLVEGDTYYFAATAYSATEVSDYSVEVVHTVPGAAPPPLTPPVATNISLHGSEDIPLSGQLSGTGADGTALTYTVVSQPGHGTLTVQDATGSFTYTPLPNYSGTDSFSYTAANTSGTSDPATVTIDLDPVNDAPVATGTTISTDANTAYSGQLSATDIEGNTLTYTLVTQGGKGSAAIAANGSFTYTPQQNVSGTDSFTFKVGDGSSFSNTASVNVTINPVNKAPIAHNSAFTVDQNTTYSGQLVATDEDGDTLSFTIATAPEKGTITMNSNGSFTYTPDPDAVGADLFTFVATDGKVNSNAGTVNIMIAAASTSHTADATFSWTANTEPVSGYKIHYGTSSRNYTFVVDVGLPEAVNGSIAATVTGLLEGQTYYFAATAYSATEESDYSVEVVHTVPGTASSSSEPPVAGNISLHGSEDIPLSGQLSGTSADGTALTYTVVAQPSHGTVTLQEATGLFTYTPVPNYSGTDSFSYTAANSAGISDPATVTIALDPVNDAPAAKGTSISIDENTSYSGQLSATDIEGSNLSYSLVTQAGKGRAAIAANGSFTYTPNAEISGADSFTFKVSDGSSDSNTASVNVTINPVNEAPITQDSSFSVDQNTAYSGQLAAMDADGDPVSYSMATAPEKGTLVMNSNGSFTYTPDPDAAGADLFTYTATDGHAISNTGTVNILINIIPDVDANQPAFELGELQVTTEWQHVALSTEYNSPAVVAKSTTSNDSEAGLVTIKNLTSTGFDIRIREWDYLDGRHPAEIVTFMAMERGQHQIADNVYAVAECTGLSGLNTFQPINFATSFSSQPVVISSIVTDNDANAAILRMKNITPQGFSITMQEQEKSDGNHAAETVCYIAMEEWSGVVDNLMVEAGSTKKILTHKPSTVAFKQQFPTIPFVLADMQSANGLDTATLGMSNLSNTGTTMTILEEQSANSEVSHTRETGGYFAITPY